ncbi:MAG TPA: hypothetical protein VGG39_02190 [Polyangiaceae bacterium]|jgi:hypothetical protein
MAARVLYEDQWVTMTFTAAQGLVRYRRSAVPYGSMADLEGSYAKVQEVVERMAPGLKLLIDVRQAPPRNDAAFEAKVNGVLDAFTARFARHATLVRTAVGKLQTARLAHERGAVPHAFGDEAEALAYLGCS